MLSSGVESLLDSSVSAVTEELYPGLPESFSRDLMAVPGPSLGLDAQSDGPVPVLAHRDGPWTSALGNFCHKTQDLGDVLQVISHGPAQSFPEELLQAGDLAEDEKSRKRHFRKLDCSGDGYQKEDEEAQGAEDHHAECCSLTLGKSWSEQEDPHLNEQEAKSLRTYCTEIAGSLRSTEENQANVQVTAETLPKLTEEVQAVPCYHTHLCRVWEHCSLQAMQYIWKLHSLLHPQSLTHFQSHCHLPPGFQHLSSTSLPLMKQMLLFQPV
ncbi:protein PRR14L isoform X2 [Ammospiza nelsoni]|uniref:protein PRR14L isoform X2 n=1 Tax=Ammospiza nelsoni TaxID=2857394 RepID=UPI002869DFB5|nr:protein PRR14L isoform X2 [Ammospiza nelsoni]